MVEFKYIWDMLYISSAVVESAISSVLNINFIPGYVEKYGGQEKINLKGDLKTFAISIYRICKI